MNPNRIDHTRDALSTAELHRLTTAQVHARYKHLSHVLTDGGKLQRWRAQQIGDQLRLTHAEIERRRQIAQPRLLKDPEREKQAQLF